MMQTELIFVRHGESYGNVDLPNAPVFHPDDPPLTPHGLLQAEALASRFAPGDVDMIFASTLLRTIQTVYPTAQKLNMPIYLLPELMEQSTRLHTTDPKYAKEHYPLVVFRDECGADVSDDTDQACFARAEAVLRDILSRAEGKRILIVTHGSFLGYLCRSALGISLPETFAWQVDNCSLTRIYLRESNIPKLSVANDTRHLCIAKKGL